MIATLLLGSTLFYTVWSVVCLVLNYRKARLMGIPLIVLPVDLLNVPWQVVQPHIWNLVDYLGINLPDWWQFLRRDWVFKKKSDVHVRLGTIYAIVTPCRIIVYCADPEANHQIFTKRHDFPRSRVNYDLLRVYGDCIVSAHSAEDWGRHRKVFATAFQNESIMQSVWDESLSQANQMMKAWKEDDPRVDKDTRTLSLNVLAAIAFRKSVPFKGAKETPVKKGRFTYSEALKIVMDNTILILLIPRKHLQYPWLPKKLRRIGKAAMDFEMHMQNLIDTEFKKMHEDGKGSGNLITSFVKAMDLHQRDPAKGISIDELMGDLFIINFAGHDTTANTLAFAVCLLVANPDIQEWVAEEIVRETRGLNDDEWDYSTLYPKLTRCRAIMMETLRIFPPVMSLPKEPLEPKAVHVDGRDIVIPPNSFIYIQTLATHTHPKFWPDEPRGWKPSRWVLQDRNGSSPNSAGETTMTPARMTYFPWSDGPMICPGMKFSQVEFVAVMLALLRRHRVVGIKEPGESEMDMRKRVRTCVDSCNSLLLLKMNDADGVKVRLERVGDE